MDRKIAKSIEATKKWTEEDRLRMQKAVEVIRSEIEALKDFFGNLVKELRMEGAEIVKSARGFQVKFKEGNINPNEDASIFESSLEQYLGKNLKNIDRLDNNTLFFNVSGSGRVMIDRVISAMEPKEISK